MTDALLVFVVFQAKQQTWRRPPKKINTCIFKAHSPNLNQLMSNIFFFNLLFINWRIYVPLVNQERLCRNAVDLINDLWGPFKKKKEVSVIKVGRTAACQTLFPTELCTQALYVVPSVTSRRFPFNLRHLAAISSSPRGPSCPKCSSASSTTRTLSFALTKNFERRIQS